MSDSSLMNPDHLKKEIKDLEQELIPEYEQLAKEIHEDIRRMFSYVEETHNRNKPTTLTAGQVTDLIQTLSKIDMHRWRYSSAEKFALKVYKLLQTDRRWIIGSKLKFLNKK